MLIAVVALGCWWRYHKGMFSEILNKTNKLVLNLSSTLMRDLVNLKQNKKTAACPTLPLKRMLLKQFCMESSLLKQCRINVRESAGSSVMTAYDVMGFTNKSVYIHLMDPYYGEMEPPNVFFLLALSHCWSPNPLEKSGSISYSSDSLDQVTSGSEPCAGSNTCA